MVVRGQKLEDLLNASYLEKVFYIEAKNKYIEEENKRQGGDDK
ncbi:MAG: hypothetical protein WBG30_13070 [Psychrilyobacter sp.]